MTILKDQRTMSGIAPLATVEDVRRFWMDFVERQRRAGRVGYELSRSRKKLVAYVSDGRWCAECPECGDGIALWIENEEGCCLGCATIFSSIEWPDPGEIVEAERVFQARPPNEWHWRPKDETVADLKVENLQRGFLPTAGEVD